MDSILKKLVKGSFAALTVKIAGALLSYLMFVALARASTPEQFGFFSFAFSVSVILAKIAVGGQQQVMLRDIPRHGEKDGPNCDLITMRSYISVLILSTVMSMALLVIVLTTSLSSDAMLQALIVAALFIPVMAFSELQTSILRAHEFSVLGMAPREVVWRLIICSIGFGVVTTLGPVLTAPVAFFICAATLAFITLGQSTAVRATQFWKFHNDWTLLKDRQWLLVSSQFWVSSVVTFGAPMLAVVIIGLFLSPEAAGAFFAALKSSQTISLVLMATNIIASPLISRHFWRGELRQVQLVCSFCAGAGTVFAGLILVLFAFSGHKVLGIFGSDYAIAYPELIILSAGYVFNAACGPNGAVLGMTKHQDRFMRIILVSNVVGIVGLPVLTHLYGTIGAACAVSGTLIIWNALASRAAKEHAKINPTVFGALLLWRNKNDEAPT